MKHCSIRPCLIYAKFRFWQNKFARFSGKTIFICNWRIKLHRAYTVKRQRVTRWSTPFSMNNLNQFREMFEDTVLANQFREMFWFFEETVLVNQFREMFWFFEDTVLANQFREMFCFFEDTVLANIIRVIVDFAGMSGKLVFLKNYIVCENGVGCQCIGVIVAQRHCRCSRWLRGLFWPKEGWRQNRLLFAWIRCQTFPGNPTQNAKNYFNPNFSKTNFDSSFVISFLPFWLCGGSERSGRRSRELRTS